MTDIDFETFWKLGPWERLGRKAAERSFKASVKTEQDWEDIQNARSAYVEHLARNKWKRPQHGSTWFNNWHDWLFMDERPRVELCKCGNPSDRGTGICDDCYRAEWVRISRERMAK